MSDSGRLIGECNHGKLRGECFICVTDGLRSEIATLQNQLSAYKGITPEEVASELHSTIQLTRKIEDLEDENKRLLRTIELLTGLRAIKAKQNLQHP